MIQKTIVKLVPSVAYVRMSTSRQEDSPERQRRQINDYASRNGYKILRWYEDHGMTGTELTKRVDYQQLISDSKLGTFTAVLIAEMSRMSREDLFTVIPQWGAFKDAGISLVSCQRGIIDFSSMGGFLSAIIDQYSAHDESRKFADRSVTGKLNRILKGERVTGNRLFAFDRNIVDATGHVLKRVSFRDKFIKSVDCRSVLVPSAEAESVEAVQWAFDHVLHGGSIGSAAREFNRRGLIGIQGKKFGAASMKVILTNPSYAGMSRAGHQCSGKFSRLTDNHAPTTRENTHAPIVERKVFDAVSSMINSRSVGKDKWKSYLLSGLCRCLHCGKPMSGQNPKDQPYRYTCRLNYNVADPSQCDVRPSFDGPSLELAVIRAWCDVFLVDDAVSQLKLKPVEDHSKHDQSELKTIGDQIALAEKNLALAANASDFKTVSAVLAQLRSRESLLREKLSRKNRKLADLEPEILKAVQQLKDARSILDDWPNVGTTEQHDELLRDLAVVFKKTISHVGLRTDISEFCGQSRLSKLKRRTGIVVFNPEHISAPDAILKDEVLAHPRRRQHLSVCEPLKRAGRPMRTSELMVATGKRVQSVRRALVICETLGIVKRVSVDGDHAGWTCCE